MADGPPPPKEEQQKLLQDVRAKRDIFAQEKARVENLLNSALEKVKLYQTLLGATESQLCGIEDLIGSIRFRLQQRGLPTRAIMIASPTPTSYETTAQVKDPEGDHPPGWYVVFICFLHAYLRLRVIAHINRIVTDIDIVQISCHPFVYNTPNQFFFFPRSCSPISPTSFPSLLFSRMATRRRGNGKQPAVPPQSHPPSTPMIVSAAPTINSSTMPLPLHTRTLRPRVPPAPTQTQVGRTAKRPHPGGDVVHTSKQRKSSKTQKKVCPIQSILIFDCEVVFRSYITIHLFCTLFLHITHSLILNLSITPIRPLMTGTMSPLNITFPFTLKLLMALVFLMSITTTQLTSKFTRIIIFPPPILMAGQSDGLIICLLLPPPSPHTPHPRVLQLSWSVFPIATSRKRVQLLTSVVLPVLRAVPR